MVLILTPPPLIVTVPADAVNEPEIDPELLKKANLDKFPKAKRYETVEEMLVKLDAPTCHKLVVSREAVLPNLRLLDPACGSGAFLVAAMKTLINVYAAILGKIDFLGDRKLIEWKKSMAEKHKSINYFIKREIITNNLYGVDIMEEATEIAKLRLFLALVSSLFGESIFRSLKETFSWVTLSLSSFSAIIDTLSSSFVKCPMSVRSTYVVSVTTSAW